MSDPSSPAAAPPPASPPPHLLTLMPAARRPGGRGKWALVGALLVLLVLLVAAGLVASGLAGRAVRRVLRPPPPTATPLPTEVPGPAYFPPPPDVTDAPDAPDPALPAALLPAATAENEGRWADALALYAPFAAGTGTPDEQREARWSQALTTYEAGQGDAAIPLFATFAADYPQDPRSVRAAFWAGQAHAAAGRPNAARQELASYAPHAGPAASTIYTHAALLARQAGQPNEARDYLTAALAGTTTRLDRINAWEQLAALAQETGQPQAALGWYDHIFAEAQVPAYRARIMGEAAALARAAGQGDDERRHLLALVRTYPDEAPAYAALHRLLDVSGTIFGDLWSSGDLGQDVGCHIAVATGKYREGLGYCEAFRGKVAAGPARADAAWWTARAYVGLEDWAQAATWWQGFAETYPSDPRMPAARLAWGAALSAAGQPQAAIAQYDALLAAAPGSVEASEGQYRAGVLGRRAGDPAGAAVHWAQAADVPGIAPDERARARYWQGYALDWAGQPAAARRAWEQAAGDHSYYGLRAAASLAGQRTPLNPGAGDVSALLSAADPALLPGQEAELRRWVAGWPQKGSGSGLATSPDGRRLLALARLGLWTEADEAAVDVGRQGVTSGDGVGLAALLMATRQGGWPWLAYRLAGSLREASGVWGASTALGDLPRGLQEGLYPLAWGSLVAQEAGTRDIDPLLLLALMRQESAYDPRARSGSDARGLTQVLPGTGKDIATGLGEPGWTANDLYQPAVAVRFGATYLRDQLQHFGGELFPALAAYNSGPGPVPGWLRAANNDPDLFVEAIEYLQTQEYVRLVWENYESYRLIYTR